MPKMSNESQPADSTVPPAHSEGRPAWRWKLGAALVIGGVLWLSMRLMGHQAGVVGLPERRPNVAVVKIMREDLAQELTVDAEFRPYQDIDLFAKIAGFVETINVDVGDQVKAGELLATLEIPELKEEIEHAVAIQRRSYEEVKKAEAEIARAEAAHDEAHQAFLRLAAADKSKPGLIAPQELDAAQARDRTAEAQLLNAKAGVAAAKEQVLVALADVNRFKAKQNYAKITAPFTGVVTKRFADPGDLVRGGTSPSTQAQPLVRLSQNERLRLVLPVSVSFVARITNGFPVEIHVEALGKTFQGKISRFTREVLTATRMMEAEVNVPNPDLELTPGMYASAILQLDRRENALVAPVQAVARQKAATVFVVNSQRRIEERVVTLGLETPTKLEIISGLKEGELVLVGGRSLVKPGQLVEPKLINQGGDK